MGHLQENTLVHEIWILWSEESCDKYERTGKVDSGDLHHYTFNTAAELAAFRQGAEEAIGWLQHLEFDHNPLDKSGKRVTRKNHPVPGK